ncbi:hypothetical protein ZIOFF_048231 [Zingiber officinale]|uniref:Uncharacterized protein n=2 Tax=Zingiber officinale TaxID=94328 RepID=A0A8J5FQX2_ZINOF|nr:hypothetical protein ZIOFF_048231 [Zingiber officinale]
MPQFGVIESAHSTTALLSCSGSASGMAEDLQLPSDLLDDGFFHDFFVERGVSVPAGSKGDKGGDLAGLVRRMGMARPFLHDDGEAWNLHAEPAGWGAEHRRRSKQERGLLNRPLGYPLGPLLALHQLQAARILHLKQQQLLQQQLHAAWEETQSQATRGLPSSRRTSFPLHHQPHPESGTRALFLWHSGARKESAGTGVFLPRTTGNKPEQQNQSDPFMRRANPVRSQRHGQPAATATCLPEEWTY